MSTFHAISATIELFPWISIWFGDNTVSNSLKIVRVNALISFLTRQTENVRRLATDLVAEAKRIETPWIKITTASIVFLGAKDQTRQTETSEGCNRSSCSMPN